MPQLLRASAVAAALALLAPTAPAAAELYRWTDEQGRLHVTQDLTRVPPGKRAEARRSAAEEGSGALQRYSAPAPARRGDRPGAAGPHRIPFERRGNVMLVHVRLNGGVRAPFVVDTGASDVAIPASLVERLGLHVGPDTPRRVYQTANGRVSKPVVTLDAVELGSARVEGVRASVSHGMDVGLLGGTFFNHFEVDIDPAEQVLTLERSDGMRGGHGEEEWRRTFERLRGDLERLDGHLEANPELPEARRAELERRREEVRAALERLRRAAREAGVPQRWRR